MARFAAGGSNIFRGWTAQQQRRKRRVPPPVTRAFINLEPTAGAHYSLSAPWVASGDFEVEFDYKLNALTGLHALCSMTESVSNDIFRVDPAIQGMLYRIGGVVYRTTGVYTEDLKLNTAKMTRTGSTVKVFRNNVEIDSRTISVVDWYVGLIGVRATTDYFDGIISRPSLIDTTTPANTLEFKLNKLTGNTELNNGVTLTYNNIAETQDVRDTYTLSADGTEWVGALRTIEVA